MDFVLGPRVGYRSSAEVVCVGLSVGLLCSRHGEENGGLI